MCMILLHRYLSSVWCVVECFIHIKVYTHILTLKVSPSVPHEDNVVPECMGTQCAVHVRLDKVLMSTMSFKHMHAAIV